MIGSLKYQLAAWLKNLGHTFAMPVMGLLSPAWRRRNVQASLVFSNPFWGQSITLSELLSDPLAVSVVPVQSKFHNASEFELLCLASIVRQTNAQHVLEIGTFDGRSTRTLASNVSTDGHVWTVNLPPGQATNASGLANVDSLLNTKVESGFRFANTPESDRITQLYGDSSIFDFSPWHGKMDVIFIDGSHTEEYVANDTAIARKLARPEGAFVIWHDSLYYGVVRYLRHQVDAHSWPVRWIEGTSMAVGYLRHGQFVEVPRPAPSRVTTDPQPQ